MICCLEIINGNLENLELLHGGFDCFLKTSAGDNVCGPYVLTTLNRTHIFKWYMARIELKQTRNRHVLHRDWPVW